MKAHDFIKEMDYDTLKKLKEHIISGELDNVVDTRIKAFENPALVCPVCESSVDETKDLVLIFGPKEFRQKARFCGHDCLNHFVNKLSSKHLNREPDLEY